MSKNVTSKKSKTPAPKPAQTATPDLQELGEWHRHVHVPSIRERVSRIHRMAGLAHVAMLGRKLPFVDWVDLEDWIEDYLSKISTEAYWVLSHASLESLGSPVPDDDDLSAVKLGATVNVEESRVTERMWKHDKTNVGER